jgi:hypothetical protein
MNIVNLDITYVLMCSVTFYSEHVSLRKIFGELGSRCEQERVQVSMYSGRQNCLI